MSTLNFPICSLFLFSSKKWCSTSNKLLSNLSQKFQYFNNWFIINLWSQLCQSIDKWLEESVLWFHKLSLHLLKSTLQLSKCNTCLQMLHYLWCLINCINLINMFCILSHPCFVLWCTSLLLIREGLLIICNISCHHSNFGFCLSQCLSCWVSQVR